MGLSQNDPTCNTRPVMAVWRSEQWPKSPTAASQSPVHTVALPPEGRTSKITPGVGAADLMPVVRAADMPPVGHMETVQPVMPPDSVPMSPDSPQTVAFQDMSVSSAPMSPKRVRDENSQDVPDEGTVFEVSPDTSGFLM